MSHLRIYQGALFCSFIYFVFAIPYQYALFKKIPYRDLTTYLTFTRGSVRLANLNTPSVETDCAGICTRYIECVLFMAESTSCILFGYNVILGEAVNISIPADEMVFVKDYADINECASDPCQHGGTCNDHLAQFECTCVPGFEGDQCENSLYFVGPDAVNWTDAESYCREQNAHLAIIQDDNETETYLTWRSAAGIAQGDPWIGGREHTTVGEWLWTRKQSSYLDFDDGQPNNSNGGPNCLVVRRLNQWADIRCTELRYPLCETLSMEPLYIIGPDEVDWNDADSYCRSQNAHLATLSDEIEAQACYAWKNAVGNSNSLWIGGISTETEGWLWFWNNEPMTYFNWGTNQPNANVDVKCIYVREDGLWYVTICADAKLPLCEKP